MTDMFYESSGVVSVGADGLRLTCCDVYCCGCVFPCRTHAGTKHCCGCGGTDEPELQVEMRV